MLQFFREVELDLKFDGRPTYGRLAVGLSGVLDAQTGFAAPLPKLNEFLHDFSPAWKAKSWSDPASACREIASDGRRQGLNVSQVSWTTQSVRVCWTDNKVQTLYRQVLLVEVETQARELWLWAEFQEPIELQSKWLQWRDLIGVLAQIPGVLELEDPSKKRNCHFKTAPLNC